jgi:uracil-DNA glycosylase family 4
MSLERIADEIAACRRCPRLIAHCQHIASVKRRAYADWEYWGRPVPSFGDPQARLLIVGLAPGAHGANRTGRMFTGDRSGDLLYRVLHRAGFASQPRAVSRDDGLELRGAYLTAAVHCAPPGNKPAPAEIRACRGYLERELDLLTRVRVVVALGRTAFDVYLSVLRGRGHIGNLRAYRFAHGAEYALGADLPTLLASYHPSQQNTQTGRLTEEMFAAVFARARELADGAAR